MVANLELCATVVSTVPFHNTLFAFLESDK